MLSPFESSVALGKRLKVFSSRRVGEQMTADERHELREKYKDNQDVQRLLDEIDYLVTFEVIVVHQGHLLSEMRAYENAHKAAHEKFTQTFEDGAKLLAVRME